MNQTGSPEEEENISSVLMIEVCVCVCYFNGLFI